ncbi:SDR family oxidoreductase [Paroceanicella profunda]|uniref:SDR family oxidoreductase n=1 Tax=Paroceanicella profunda TaxID=2579971 RepID=A0A5B8FHE7_9RHOB|nr:SDR family oxidoreductase [Paroceanicella profunda]QDL92117.1 SDR family oxidoreductase [Paroceanicella profunda]
MKAIITGHSRGLGAALAAELLGQGAKVLGLARGSAAGLAAQYPERFREAALDLSDAQAVTAWAGAGGLAAFLEGGEGPVMLINNAGTVEPIGPAGTLAPASVAQAVALNVTVPLLLSEAFIAATMGSANRRILHVSSGAGRKPYAGWSVYCATKAALDHHALTVAQDAVPGLRIASMAPGVVDTDMQAIIRGTSEEQFVLRENFVSLKESGALARPQDTAAVMVSYLLGEAFGSVALCDVRDLA